MGILSSLTVYRSEWGETKPRKSFSEDEVKNIKDARVVQGDYGLQARLDLVSGGYCFITLSRDSKLRLNDPIDVKNAVIITLSRPGDCDIIRLEEGSKPAEQKADEEVAVEF